jgi:hypothetical protein
MDSFVKTERIWLLQEALEQLGGSTALATVSSNNNNNNN